MRLSGIGLFEAIVFVLVMIFIIGPLMLLKDGFNWVKTRIFGYPEGNP